MLPKPRLVRWSTQTSNVTTPLSRNLLRQTLHQHTPRQTSSPTLLPRLEKGGSNRLHGGYSNVVPADVALVSPQTPPTPLYNPLLAGGYSKPYPWIPFCLRAFSGFFASSLAIIRLNKLSTLSLRSFPPLKPFERRDQSADIHDIICRTQGPILLASNHIFDAITILRSCSCLLKTIHQDTPNKYERSHVYAKFGIRT